MLKDKNIYVIPCLGFLSVILVGWIVLMLPICNNGNVTPFDALFTAGEVDFFQKNSPLRERLMKQTDALSTPAWLQEDQLAKYKL